MPIATFDSVEIRYEIIAHGGPWVAAISSARSPLEDVEVLARSVASYGYRVLVHDRRNCGRSSLMFDTFDPDENVWADDLSRLLDCLGISRAVVVGYSRGARVAVRFALRHPDRTRALLLWGISGVLDR